MISGEALTQRENEEIPYWLRPLAKVRFYYGKVNQYNGLIHVRAIVDGRIVCCKWNRYKQQWVYKVEDPYWFELNDENGHCKFAGMDKE